VGLEGAAAGAADGDSHDLDASIGAGILTAVGGHGIKLEEGMRVKTAAGSVRGAAGRGGAGGGSGTPKASGGKYSSSMEEGFPILQKQPSTDSEQLPSKRKRTMLFNVKDLLKNDNDWLMGIEGEPESFRAAIKFHSIDEVSE
jgi:hypothetical protein